MTRAWNPFDDANGEAAGKGRELGGFVAAYYGGLVEGGVPNGDALYLTARLIDTMTAAMTPKTPSAP